MLVDMTVNPNPVIAGANVTYTITVSNNGPDDATGVSLSDTLPTGLSLVSFLPAQGSCSGTTAITCTLGSVAASSQVVVTLVAQTTQSGTISNTASVAANESDPDPTNNSVTKPVTANVGADMGVTLAGAPNPVIAGGNLTYTVSSSNAGPSPATGVTITGSVPSGTSYVSATGTGWTCSVAGATVTCSRSGSAPVGALPAIALVVRATNGGGGNITDTVTIAANEQDSNSSNNSATITTAASPGADLQFSSQTASPNPVAVGGTATYSIVAKNGGPASASTITLTDTLPANVTYVSAAGTGWTCNNSGQTVTCTLPGPVSSGANMATVLVTATAASLGAATNSVTISAPLADPNAANNTSTATTTVAAAGSDMSITVTGTPNPVASGSNITYSVTAKNNGPNATAGTLTMTDTLPATLTYVSAAGSGWTCGSSGQVVTCTNVLTYASGVSAPPISLVATSTGTGAIVNNACIAVASPADPNSANNCVNTSVSATSNQSDLAVTQTASPDPLTGGGTLTYSITVTNNGPSDATAVTLSDTFSSATFVSATPSQGTCVQNATMTCSLGTIANGAVATVTVVVKPTVTGTRTNTASVASGGVGDPILSNNTSSISSVINAGADLTLTHVAAPNPVLAATALTYVLTVKNNGPSTATSVTLTDTLPSQATYVSATPSTGTCSYSAAVVTCNLGSIANSIQQTVTVVVTPQSQGNTPYTMTASASVASSVADPNTSDNSASFTSTVNPAQVDVQITKYGTPNPVAFGSNVTYTITVHNSGPSTATGIVTTDTPMSQFTFVSSTASQGSCSGTSPVVCNIGTLANGANATITMVMTASTMGTFTNQVSVTSNETDSNTSNNAASESTTSRQGADLSITKTGSPNPVSKDGTLTYTLAANNAGPANSVTTTVTDTLPAGVTFVSATGSQGSCTRSGSTVTCNFGSMLSGGTATATIIVTPTVVGTLSNTASITGSSPDGNLANNSATITTMVGAVADLTLTKTHAGSFSAGQSSALYTLTVTNSGGAATTAPVSLVDTVPAGLTPVSAAGTGWTCGLAGQIVTCNRSDALAAGASYGAVTVTVSVALNAASSVTNSATVSGGGEVVTTNDTATDVTLITAVPDLTITMVVPTSPVPGGSGAYTWTANNAGAAATSGTVSITDTFPASVTPGSATGTGWTCATAAQIVTCTRSDALAAGLSYPVVSVPVTFSPTANGTVPNTATVSGGGEANTANDTATGSISFSAVPDLTITMVVPTSPVPTGTGAYLLTANNTGAAATSGTVTITDTFPASVTPGSATGTGWTCATAAQMVTCTRSDALAAGLSYPVVSVPVTFSPTASGTAPDTATVSGGGEANTANDAASGGISFTAVPDLTITMVVPTNPVPGGTGAYSLTANNAGAAATSGTVTITDTFPASITPGSATGTGWTCNTSAQTVTCTRSDALAAAQSYPVVSVPVTFSPTASGTAPDTATVSGGGEANTANDTATGSISFTAVPDLTITMVVPTSPVPGGSGAYTLTANNTGAAASSGAVSITDTFPASVTPGSATGTGWTCNTAAQNITCTRSDALAAALSYPVVSVPVTFSPTASGTVPDTATVNGGAEANTANDAASGSISFTAIPDLTITMVVPTSPVPGGTGAYTLTANNTGAAASSGMVTITDTFPASVTPGSATGNGWTCNTSAQAVTCTRSDALAATLAYPVVSVPVTFSPTASGTAPDTATVSGGGEANTANDTATGSISFTAVPDLTITLVVPTSPVPGGTGAYTLTANNTGATASSGMVTITDTFPTSVTPGSATGTGWTCTTSAQTVTCSRTDALAATLSYPVVSVPVTFSPTASGTAPDTATVSGGGEANTANDTATGSISFTAVPDLTITLVVPTSPVPGGTGAYTLTANNTGAAASSGVVTITDTFPASVTPGSATGIGWTCNTAAQNITCTRSDALAATLSYPVVSVPVTFSPTANGTVPDTATVSGGGEANTANDTASGSISFSAVPDLTITMVVPISPVPGGTGAYTWTANNAGAAASSGVVTITDTFPASVTPGSATGIGWTCNTSGQTVTCARSDALAAGLSYPVVSVPVTFSPTTSGTVSDTANVSGGGEANTANDTATGSISFTAVPDLTITMVVPTSAVPGGTGAYTLTANNMGATATSGTITITDTFPASVTPGSATGIGWNCTTSAQTVTCTRSDALTAALSYPVVSVPVTFSPTASGTAPNTATVSGGGEANTANDTATGSISFSAVPDLTLTMTNTGNFAQGALGSFTLHTTNAGSSSTTGPVTITDTYPAALRPGAASGIGWSCSTATQTVTCTRADSLAAGNSYPDITSPVTVIASASNTFINSATVSGGGESNLANDVAINQGPIGSGADLSISLNLSTPLVQGGSSAYTVGVTNAGPIGAAGLTTVSDILPAGLTPNNPSGTGWSCATAAQTVTCTRSDALASGAAFPVITIPVIVVPSAPGNISDTVTLSNPSDVNPANNTATVASTTAAGPDLTLSMTGAGSFAAGTSASYTLTAKNIGATQTTGVVTVTDALPSVATPTAASGNGWACSVAVQQVTCTRNDALSANTTYPPIVIPVLIASVAPPTLTNTASISGGGEINIANDTAMLTGTISGAPDLTILLSSTSLAPEGSGSFALTVKNVGGYPTDGTSVTVSDTLPTGLQPILASGAGWNCSTVGQTVSCLVTATLAAGQAYPVIAIPFRVLASAPANVIDLATVSGGGDTNNTNNTASVSVSLPQSPDLTLTQGIEGAPPAPGKTAQILLSVQNKGIAPTSGTVTVTDTLPPGLTASVANGSGWNCVLSRPTLSCTRSDVLNVGGTYPPIEVLAEFDKLFVGAFSVAGLVAGGGETNTANDSATLHGSIHAAPDLTITISQPASLHRGDTGTFQLNVNNIGSGATSGAVTVVDVFAPGLSPTQSSSDGWTCNIAGQVLTCTRDNPVLPGAAYPVISCTAVVTAAAGALSDAASVSVINDSNPANNQDSKSTALQTRPALVIAKTHSGTFLQGGHGTFSLRVTNTGDGATDGTPIVVNDPVPAGLTPQSAAGDGWSCRIEGQLVTCDRSDSVAPGVVLPQIAVDVLIPSGASPSITNIANVSGGGSQPSSQSAAHDSVTITTPPDLTLTKTHTGTLTRGQPIAYTLVVSNLSAAPTSGVVTVIDSLPARLLAVSASGPGWICSGLPEAVNCSRSDALAGKAAYAPIVVTANVDLQAPDSITNTATVSGGGDLTPLNNQAIDTAPVSGQANLTLTITHSGTLMAGATTAFTLLVSNESAFPTDGTPIVVTDTLPAGLAAVSGSGVGWICTVAAPVVRCTYSRVIPSQGSPAPVLITARVTAAAGQTVNNSASVGGGGVGAAASGSSVASTSGVVLASAYPGLRITKSHSGSFTQGGTGNYTLSVANVGSAATVGTVTVVDNLPPSLSATKAVGDGWNCVVQSTSLSCSRSDSAPANEAFPVITLTTQVALDAPAQIVNSATVSGGGMQGGDTNTATDPTVIQPAPVPSMTLLKLADRSEAQVGDTVNYSVQVANPSPVSIAGAEIRDQLPASFRYVPGSAHLANTLLTNGNSLQVQTNGSTLTFLVGQLQPHQNLTVTYRVRVGADAASGDHTNTALVTGLSPNGQSLDPVSARAVVRIGQNLLTMQRPLIGRVYVDENSNGKFDAGDVAVERARVYLNDGQSAITDSAGFYSFPFVGDGSVVIALDPITLPTGYTVGSQGERSGESWTRLVRTPLSSGTLVSQNFGLRRLPGAPEISKAGSAFAIRKDAAPANKSELPFAPLPPASAIRPGEISIAAPSANFVTSAARVSVTAHVSTGWSIAISANRQPIGTTPDVSLSKTYPAFETTAVTVPAVSLETGPNTFTVCAVPPPGMLLPPPARCADVRVHRSGPAKRLVLTQANPALIANGQDSLTLDIHALDAWDQAAADTSVTVRTTLGHFLQVTKAGPLARKSFSEPSLTLANIGGGTGGLFALSAFDSTQSVPEAVLPNPTALVNSESGVGTRNANTNGNVEQVDHDYREQTLELRAGEAHLQLQASNTPGGAEVVASTRVREEITEGRIWVSMLPELRSPILSAVGEVSIGRAAPEISLFGESGDVHRRGGFFYRGALPGSNLLTLAYLSQRPLNRTSGYDRMFELDPVNEQYLVFGDSSARMYNAQSNTHLFGRLDHGLSYLLFGDLSGDLAQQRLNVGISDFDRNITGLKLHLEDKNGASLNLTGARPNTAYARETFPGSSIGLIALGHQDVLAGSETVVLETRDRRNPEIIVSRETLVRTVDYTMDALSGAVFFLRSISPLDSLLNLTQIVFTYEYRSAGLNSAVYRAQAQKLFDNESLRLGLEFLNERDSGNSYLLAGLNAALKLARGGFLRLEAPLSHGALNGSSVTADGGSDSNEHSGVAVRAELEEPIGAMGGIVRANFSKTDRDFYNPFGATVLPGSQTASASFQFNLFKLTTLKFAGVDERNQTSRVDNSRSTVEASWKQALTERFDTTLTFDHRDLSDVDNSRYIDSNLLSAGAEWRITDKLQVGAAREQNLSAADPTYPDQTLLSAKFQLTPDTRLFYTQRIASAPIVPIGDISAAGFAAIQSKNELAIGFETRVQRWTSFGTRYQIENGINGTDSFAIMGIVDRVPINDTTSIDLGLEHAIHVSGSGHDYDGATLAVGWHPTQRFRATERYELRDRYGFASLLSSAVAGRFTDAITALGQVQFVQGNTLASSASQTTTIPAAATAQIGNLNRVLASLAVRPTGTDQAGLLFSYNRQDVHTIAVPSTVSILSTDAWWEPVAKLDFYGRFAFSQYRQNITDASPDATATFLSQGRVQYRFAKLFDVAAESRWLQQPSSQTGRQASAAELGGWLFRDVRLAVGYNFESVPDYAQRFLAVPIHRGVYFNVTGKFSRLFDLFGTAYSPVIPDPAPVN